MPQLPSHAPFHHHPRIHQSAPEPDHHDLVAFFDFSFAQAPVQGERDGRRGSIAAGRDTFECFFDRETRLATERLDDAHVCAMGDKPVDVINIQFAALGQHLHLFGHSVYGPFEHGAAVLVDFIVGDNIHAVDLFAHIGHVEVFAAIAAAAGDDTQNISCWRSLH